MAWVSHDEMCIKLEIYPGVGEGVNELRCYCATTATVA